MARGVELDPLFANNFALADLSLGIPDAPFAFPSWHGMAPENRHFVSFSGISLPTIQQGTMEIEEGNGGPVHMIATGKVTAGEVTLRRAVIPSNFDFFHWFYQGIYGRLGPRRNFFVAHLGKDKTTIRRIYNLYGCIPTSWQISSEFEADSGDVSLEELTMHVSEIEIDEESDLHHDG